MLWVSSHLFTNDCHEEQAVALKNRKMSCASAAHPISRLYDDVVNYGNFSPIKPTLR